MARAQAAPRANSAAEPWYDWTEPAHEADRRPAPAPARRRPVRMNERRRRAEHYRRRRRDLLVDAALALVLAIILISLTAGLGILLLLVVPMAIALIAHRIVRWRRAHRAAPLDARRRRSRPRPARG